MRSDRCECGFVEKLCWMLAEEGGGLGSPSGAGQWCDAGRCEAIIMRSSSSGVYV